MRLATRTAMLAGLLLSLVGCAGADQAGPAQPEPTGSAATSPSGPSASASATGGSMGELTITVRRAPDAEPVTYTLTCDPPGGSHPDPAAACRALQQTRDPFAPVPKDVACTDIYGGPQTAQIAGSWQGRQVNANYRRTDGCEIARWDRLAAVFQLRGGA